MRVRQDRLWYGILLLTYRALPVSLVVFIPLAYYSFNLSVQTLFAAYQR